MSDPTGQEEIQRLRQQLRRRERELRDRDRLLRQTQERLVALEASTALRVGRRLAAAARKPAKGLIGLPRDLYKMAKGRSTAGRTAAPSVTDVTGWPRLRTEVGQDERMLFGAGLRRHDRPVIAGAFTAGTRAALAADAEVIPLRPYDAGVVVDQCDPDVVVFEAAACVAGHPWAYLGDPAMLDRQRALRDVREAARPLNRPVVLWNNAPDAAPVAPALPLLGWDAVHDAEPGEAPALDTLIRSEAR
ncbi:hypothetical protein [Actinomadura kijaniata]|uniref:hypothetical protein n=1 Tax=Actinomadura kijaniata TaxID=46161 RepID=UPI0008353533|nr:hypothetical protein [Actinomadura kijaniata]